VTDGGDPADRIAAVHALYVDAAGAEANLQAEQPAGTSFDTAP